MPVPRTKIMATRLEKCPESPRNAYCIPTKESWHHITTAKRAPTPPANRAAACVAIAAAFDDDDDDVVEDELAGRDEDPPLVELLELGLLVMRLLLVGAVTLPLLDAPEPVADPDALPENVMVPEGLAEKLPDSVGEDTGGPLSGGALPEDSTGILSPHRHIFLKQERFDNYLVLSAQRRSRGR